MPSHARRSPITDTRPLPAWMTHHQTENMEPPDPRFHQLGRIIATLELGARAHGDIRWLHLYYGLGFLPRAGLREPLQKHLQSVLPTLHRKGIGERYRETLDLLATELQNASGTEPRHHTFDGWASQVLKDGGLGDRVETMRPGPPLPDDAVLYAEGYLEQRRELQANRPPAPPEENQRSCPARACANPCKNTCSQSYRPCTGKATACSTTGTITWAAS